MGEQSSQKCDSLRLTPVKPVQNLTPLALFSAEKSVTVQTPKINKKNKQ